MVMMMINPPLNPPADAGQALPGGERKKAPPFFTKHRGRWLFQL